MLIPLNTDAPVYHYPYATLGLMLINCAVFALTGTGDVENHFTQQLVVHFGEGLRPHEWLTSLFVHFGYLHLIGNMIFLWGFGLVVEGKLGWWKYLLVYLAVGATVSFIAQTL
ncbi:MAG: rhomboid family intramembrane serine protease, partial [Planctomycetaceae bacterium]